MIYQFDFSRMTLQDYIVLNNVGDQMTNKAVSEFLPVMARLCTSHKDLTSEPISILGVIIEDFIAGFMAYYEDSNVGGSFMDKLEGDDDQN